MRSILAAALFLFAAAAAAQPLGYDGARHLLNRTGFGATDAEIRAFAPLSREAAVRRLLEGSRREATLAPPAFVNEPFTPFYKLRAMTAEERMADTRKVYAQGFELRAWWLAEMLATPSPLTERMTLFWHNHFATSQRKVRMGQLMYRQNVLLRREALGNFATLLHAVARDPAMLIYLDNAGSRAGAPNENFAREVMELFTLGEGHYAERDVKEAARAFTGWSLERDTGEFKYRRAWHDTGEKTVFGKTGNFDGDGVIDLLLARPETAELVAAKLWRELVSPQPDPVEVKRWAKRLRDSRYEVKPLLETILLSEAFWSPANRASLIKSPIDLVVGTLRTFAIEPTDLRPAAFAAAALGQNPFSPPNVKGWPGGEAWIDSAMLLARKQFLERLFRGSDAMAPAALGEAPAAMREAPVTETQAAMRRMLERGMASYAFDAQRWSRSLGDTPVEKVALAASPMNSAGAALDGIEHVRAVVADPVYQLK